MECGSVVVPLDRAGIVPGQITLHVRRIVARPSRGVMLYVEGGPGAAGTPALDSFSHWRRLFPGYTLAAFDMRGTGASGLLLCESLQRDSFLDLNRTADLVGACAATLGPARAFYTTRAAADDLDAIRQALGVERIGLYGASYGTKLALAYALAYPTRVERLLLESVLLPENPDPFQRSTLAAIPSVLASICAGRLCRATTPTPFADFVTLANRLAARPLRGTVIGSDGRPRVRSASVDDLFQLLGFTDVDPATRAALPAVVRSAVQGDGAPLLRLVELLLRRPADGSIPPEALSLAATAATICEDATFPWARSAVVEGRAQAWQLAAAQLPPEAYTPFGPWAATLSPLARICLRWPQSSTAPALGPGPLPDVPVLTLAGDLDLRTPASDALVAAQLFPRGRFLLVPGAGHGVLGTPCADQRVTAWIERDVAPAPCPRRPAFFEPEPRAPRSAAEIAPVAGVRGKRGRTLRAVALTLSDASSLQRLVIQLRRPIGGLRGGQMRFTSDGAVLRRFSYVPGIWVSGDVEFVAGGRVDGTVTVGGPAAAAGTLVVRKLMHGMLGGKQVRIRRP